MGRISKRKANRGVTPAEVKLCTLCGTLNYGGNADCFTCGWSGEFCRDAETVEQAWRLMTAQHGLVLLEHLTGSRTARISELVTVETSSPKPCDRRPAWWRRLLGRRPAPASETLPPLPTPQPPRRPTPPNGLGV